MRDEISVTVLYMGNKRSPGGCEIYRGNMPMHFLGHQPGWNTKYGFIGDIFRDKEKALNNWAALIKLTDIFVFPRMTVYGQDDTIQTGTDQLNTLYDLLKGMGKKIVYETDDDYTNQYRDVTEGGDAMLPAKMADAMTVTTPYLARVYRGVTNIPIHVLPNCIDPELWRDAEEPERSEDAKGKIIISLTGSATHEGDWKVLETVMPDFLEAHPEVHFVVMGFHPEYLKDLPNTSYFPGLRYERYSQIIRGSDVILCPVDPDDGFNLGKSPIKAIEGQAARRTLNNGKAGGAAVIATNNPVYRLSVKDQKTGLLTEHTPEGWRNALELVLDGELRTSMQMKGHSWVYKHHDMSKEWRQWARAYRRILNSSSN